MSGLSISPWDSLHFVGTDMGTLFRSEDAGATWEPVSYLEARYTSHLDIAGPAFIEKDHAYTAQGGTGFAVRTLVSLIESGA